MKDRLGVGVVGAGAIAIRGVLTHLSQDDVQDKLFLAAVCDPVPGRAEAAAAKFGVAADYLTYEDLLADPAVDLITLCSPIGLHYEQGLLAIEAGKHVHFNKTMTTTAAEADELIARAAEKGVKLVASPGMMAFPHNQRLRRKLAEGALGTLSWAITGASGAGDYHLGEEFRTGEDILTDINPAWYFRKPGGGPQYDVTVYCLHILTGMVGPAKRVTALSGLLIPERAYRGEAIACDMDDTTMLLLDFGQAFFACVYACPTGGITQAFQPNVYGTAGAIVGTTCGGQELKQPDDRPPHVNPLHVSLPEFHVYEDLMQLVDFIQHDTPPIASVEHARHVVEIIEAGYRSAETGQCQELVTGFEPIALDALVD